MANPFASEGRAGGAQQAGNPGDGYVPAPGWAAGSGAQWGEPPAVPSWRDPSRHSHTGPGNYGSSGQQPSPRYPRPQSWSVAQSTFGAQSHSPSRPLVRRPSLHLATFVTGLVLTVAATALVYFALARTGASFNLVGAILRGEVLVQWSWLTLIPVSLIGWIAGLAYSGTAIAKSASRLVPSVSFVASLAVPIFLFFAGASAAVGIAVDNTTRDVQAVVTDAALDPAQRAAVINELEEWAQYIPGLKELVEKIPEEIPGSL